MPPIISIVGKSDSGKTTLLEKLISEFRKRGYLIGTIKHDIHGFDIDHEGKDSWRHKKAGAVSVVISSPSKLAVIKDTDEDKDLDLLVAEYLPDVDIIFTEGYKRENKPKIEVFRKEIHKELLCLKDENLIALVTNQRFVIGVPCFDIDDVKGLSDFIEEKFLKVQKLPSVSLTINGKYSPLKPFIQEMFINTISGMVSALKGGKEARSIKLTIKLPE